MKTRTWIIVLGIVLLLSLAGSYFLLSSGEPAAYAQIASDGTVIATFDLSKDDSITVAFGDGYNHVDVRNGRIAVTEATCPDHYCMQRGYCNSGTPIVCLPNKLVISFLGEQEIDISLG